MPKSRLFTLLCMSLLMVFVFACNKNSDQSGAAETRVADQAPAGQLETEHQQGEQAGEEHEQGEHAEKGEHGEQTGKSEHAEQENEHGAEGEESGPRIPKNGTHDEVRKGVRLILIFDGESSSFIGTAENVTEKTVAKVRVEVHLSNGTELGPTDPLELAPGEKIDIKLSAEGQSFIWWKAHAEAGESEH